LNERVLQENERIAEQRPPNVQVAKDSDLDETVEKVRRELQSLRLEVMKNNSTVVQRLEALATVSEAKADQEESFEIDKVEFLMSAEAVHGRALELLESVKASREGTVYLMAYSFDRKDISEALIGLVGLPKVKLTMLVDNRQTLKGPKEQLSVLQELVSRGVAVRLLSGKGLADEYKAAGRSAKLGGLIGIQHSKLLFVRTGNKTSLALPIGRRPAVAT